MPEVCAIIPTYNRSHLLERAVRSILAQKFRDFEIIIIDDASTDHTDEMVKSTFGDELSKGMVRYVRNERTMERSFSRNRGMEMATGDYIAFLDDDDIWFPEHLDTSLRFLNEERDVGCVFSNFIQITFGKKAALRLIVSDLTTGRDESYRRLCITGNLGSPSTAVLRRSVYESIGGFNTGISVFEDREFFSRVAMKYPVGFLACPTVCRYLHPGSYSRPSADVKEDILHLIEENAKKYGYPIDNILMVDLLMDVSHTFMCFGNISRARDYFRKALKADFRAALSKQTAGSVFRIMLGQHAYTLVKDLKGMIRNG